MQSLTIKADDIAKAEAKNFANHVISQGYRAESLHVYTNANGDALYWRIRAKHPNGTKWLRPMRKDGEQFKLEEPPHSNGRPLYNLALLHQFPDKPVMMMEGEKAADAATHHGVISTSTGGAMNIFATDLTPLARRVVHLWSDNDDTGRQWLENIIPQLLELHAQVFVINPADLGLDEKADAYDWYQMNGNTDIFTLPWQHIVPEIAPPEPLRQRFISSPYPIETLPKLMREAVQENIAYAQCPTAIAAMSALQTLAAVAQGLADVARDNELISVSSLFLLTIADSGERKTAVDNHFMRSLRAFEQTKSNALAGCVKLAAAEKMQWQARKAGLIKATEAAASRTDNAKIATLREAMRELELDEPMTVRLPRIEIGQGDFSFESVAFNLYEGWPSALLATSEAGTFFGGRAMDSTSITSFLSMLNLLWDGKPYPIDRRNTGNKFVVTGRRLSVALMVQYTILADFLRKRLATARGGGFLARFLIAYPESTIGQRQYRTAPSHWPAQNQFNQRISELAAAPLPMHDTTGNLTPTLLQLNTEAFAIWREYYNQIETESGRWGMFADLKDCAAKSAENAARLACLFHMLQHGTYGLIDADSMRRACSLALWHLGEAKKLFTEACAEIRVLNAERLEAWLIDEQRRTNNEPVSISTIQKFAPNQLRKKEVLNPLLEKLAHAGRITVTEQGRAKLIKLHPAILDGSLDNEAQIDPRMKKLAEYWKMTNEKVAVFAVSAVLNSEDENSTAITAKTAISLDINSELIDKNELESWLRDYEDAEPI